MIGAVVFVIFFVLFLVLTLEVPTLPPGDMIHNLLEIPRVNYPIVGIPASLLITAIVNGVVYGFLVWLAYSIASAATRSRKKKEERYQPPPAVPPPPQYSPPPATPTPTTPPSSHTPPQYVPIPVMPPARYVPQQPAAQYPPQTIQQPSQGVTGMEGATSEELTVSAENLVDKVKELLHEGNVTRIIVKDEKGRILLDMPASVGVAGAVAAPWLAGLGAIAALATKCTIGVVRQR